jgi:hypothetical protein
MHSTVAAEEDFFASSTIIITTHPPALSGRRTINIYWAVSFFLSFFSFSSIYSSGEKTVSS